MRKWLGKYASIKWRFYSLKGYIKIDIKVIKILFIFNFVEVEAHLWIASCFNNTLYKFWDWRFQYVKYRSPHESVKPVYVPQHQQYLHIIATLPSKPELNKNPTTTQFYMFLDIVTGWALASLSHFS